MLAMCEQHGLDGEDLMELLAEDKPAAALSKLCKKQAKKHR